MSCLDRRAKLSLTVLGVLSIVDEKAANEYLNMLFPAKMTMTMMTPSPLDELPSEDEIIISDDEMDDFFIEEEEKEKPNPPKEADITPYYHLSTLDAAKAIGVNTYKFRKAWREATEGKVKWPCLRVRSLSIRLKRYETYDKFKAERTRKKIQEICKPLILHFDPRKNAKKNLSPL